MTFKSEKKTEIAEFKEDNYPDHDCFNDEEGEDGKCSKELLAQRLLNIFGTNLMNQNKKNIIKNH